MANKAQSGMQNKAHGGMHGKAKAETTSGGTKACKNCK